MGKHAESVEESEGSLAVEDLVIINSRAMPQRYAAIVGLRNLTTNHAFDEVDEKCLFLLAKISKVQVQQVHGTQVQDCEIISVKVFVEFEKTKTNQGMKPVKKAGLKSLCRLSAAFVMPSDGIIIHWNGCADM